MENPIQNLDKALLFSGNQVFCLKNWKIWRTQTTIDFNNFSWNFAHVPFSPMSTKACVGFFLFSLEPELFAKIKKYLVSTHSWKPGLAITQDLNKILKNPTHAFVDIRKTERCVKFQQKIIKFYCSCRARQSFQFFRQINWILGNTRALSKFKYWILHHLISTIKLQNN